VRRALNCGARSCAQPSKQGVDLISRAGGYP
jgi:hypothetical protein